MQNITSLLKNERAKTAVLTAAIVALIQLFAVLVLTIAHPYTGEILHNALISVGLFINAALAGVCCLMIVAAFAWNFKKGIQIDFDFSGAKQLPAGPAHRLGVDIPVFSHPNESGESFTARLTDETKNACPAKWVVAIQRGNPIGVIYSAPDTLTKFDRHRPPFEKEVMPDADRCAPEWANFSAETEYEYAEYLRRFSAKWPDYSAAQKLDSVHKAQIGDTFASVARAISVACFVLFSVILPAQTKTEQVVSAFGGTGGVPEPGAEIVYQFQNGDIARTADGRRNYVELLKSVPGFQDDGGRLVAVWSGTSRVAMAQDVERANARPASKSEQMRPAGDGSVIRPTDEQIRNTFAMPDSAEAATDVEQWKTAVLRAKESAGQGAAPYIEFSWWFFLQIIGGLIFAATVLWFFAKTSSEEGIQNAWGETIFISSWLVFIHQNCSALLMVVLWSGWIFIFIKVFVELVSTSLPLLASAVVFIIVVVLIRRIHNKIVPNIRVLGGGGAGVGQMGGSYHGQKRLG